LAPEQRPIAERLAAGGIPAVRRAIAEERERARAEGRPEVSGEAILALAEQIAPSVKQATWLDRAEAAVAQLEQLSLRDLRTTVAAAAPRDEAARDLDRKLREELDRRVKKLRSHWEEQMTHALEEGRVLQALRFSAQPPEPTARFPASLVERLAASAGAGMTASTPVERWLAILEAATASPIRRQIHPEGLPEDPSGEIARKARLAAGAIPALAPMIGLSMPPPPKPIKGARPPRLPRPPARGPKRSAPPAKAEPRAADTATEDASSNSAPSQAPAGAPDTGAPDTGALETGALETGALETGALETGALEAAVIDAPEPSAVADAPETITVEETAQAETDPTEPEGTAVPEPEPVAQAEESPGAVDIEPEAAPEVQSADVVEQAPLSS
jgi:hypothetical protein